MGKVKVNVKWGKEAFNDVELDLDQPPLVFKSQLFALSAVPPDRQKIMIKGGLLKDDDWGKQVPKDGMTLMMMGSADAVPVEPPKNVPVFVEDLPEAEREHMETKKYGAGLTNLGNTCYMNATVQCLYAVAPLRTALGAAPSLAGGDATSKLVLATKDLFKDLEKGGAPFPPFRFLMTLREKFPQFAQTTNEGIHMQQDAEECWTNLMYALREKLKDEGGENMVEKLFGVRTRLKLKCEESGEEVQDESTAYMLKCNISSEVNHLSQGLQLGLQEDREKNSEKLGRLALFKGSSSLTALPPYLPVQMVRFFYRADVQQKAKVLRKVTFPLELDVFEFCADELQRALEGPRLAYKESVDRRIEEQKLKKSKKEVRGKNAAAESGVFWGRGGGAARGGVAHGFLSGVIGGAGGSACRAQRSMAIKSGEAQGQAMAACLKRRVKTEAPPCRCPLLQKTAPLANCCALKKLVWHC